MLASPKDLPHQEQQKVLAEAPEEKVIEGL